MEIRKEQNRYVGTIENVDGEAELVFEWKSPTLLVAVHTLAPPSMKGTGVAAALVDRLIADARKEGFKIIPQCPYVRAQYKRHPEWSDVMREAGDA